MASLIDNFDLDAMLPKDVILTVKSDGNPSSRPTMPNGVVQVTMETHTQTQPTFYAHGGHYRFTRLGYFSGEPGMWRCTFQVAATGGNTSAYPYWGSSPRAEDVGAPCTMIYQRMGGATA